MQREALFITPNTRFQRDGSSGWGKYPAMVGGKRHKNGFAVALIVWKMSDIRRFFDRNSTKAGTGEDARAYIESLVVPKWNPRRTM